MIEKKIFSSFNPKVKPAKLTIWLNLIVMYLLILFCLLMLIIVLKLNFGIFSFIRIFVMFSIAYFGMIQPTLYALHSELGQNYGKMKPIFLSPFKKPEKLIYWVLLIISYINAGIQIFISLIMIIFSIFFMKDADLLFRFGLGVGFLIVTLFMLLAFYRPLLYVYYRQISNS